MKNILIATMLSLGLAFGYTGSAEAATCDKAIVKVNGLVCDFCARALEKVFSTKSEVEKIAVNLDAGQIDITYKPGQKLEEAELKKLVEDAGYTPTAFTGGCS